MPGVEKAHRGLRYIALERLGASRQEERIVLSPCSQERRQNRLDRGWPNPERLQHLECDKANQQNPSGTAAHAAATVRMYWCNPTAVRDWQEGARLRTQRRDCLTSAENSDEPASSTDACPALHGRPTRVSTMRPCACSPTSGDWMIASASSWCASSATVARAAGSSRRPWRASSGGQQLSRSSRCGCAARGAGRRQPRCSGADPGHVLCCAATIAEVRRESQNPRPSRC
jgi:hypothetical protein